MDNRFRRASLHVAQFVALAVLVFSPACSFSQSAQAAQISSGQIDDRVESLLKKMTLEEKLGQLSQYAAGFATGPNESKLTYDELIQRGAIGSMLNEIGRAHV